MARSILAERYELLEDLGSGGMATVWRARDRRLDRQVAVKVLSGSLASDPDFRRRFDREARHVASLTHPNIVTVHDSGSEGNRYYLVMELIEGESLDARLAATSPYMDLDETLRLARGVLAGLSRAHAAGVIHRDIKPANILITSEGVAKVADFGIAKDAAESDRLTSAGMFMGTLSYAPPEQLEGRPGTAASDLYSVGCVLYECLVGHPPFQAELSAGVVAQHLQASPAPLRDERPEIPAHVEAAVLRALEKDPDRRFRSAADMSTALGEGEPGVAHRSLPTVMRQAETPAPVGTAGRRRGWRWSREGTIVAAAILAVGAATVVPLLLLGVGTGGTDAAGQPVDCIARHHLPGARAVISPSGSETIFVNCDSPAPDYADRSGYSAINVVTTLGAPDEPSSGLDRADLITSPCEKLRLVYQYTGKGGVISIAPFIVSQGQIVTVIQTYGGPWSGDPSTLPFRVSSNEVVVLHNTRNAIVSAACVS